MSTYDKSAYEAAMVPLRKRFLERVRRELERLNDHANGKPLAEDELRRAMHSLAGSLGIYGYAKASALAGELDDELTRDGTCRAADFASLIGELEAMLANAAPVDLVSTETRPDETHVAPQSMHHRR